MENKDLLTIGKLAKETGERISTIRFWLTRGLLKSADKTASGYYLFEKSAVGQAKKIRQLQETKRLTIEEIGDVING